MKKLPVIHPFLFAIFPVLFLFAHNVGQVSFSEILLPTAIVLGFTLLLLLLFRLILRDSKKAGIVVSILLILVFSYGHAFNLIRGGGEVGYLHRYLLPPWGMLFICSAYFIIKTHKNLHNFTNVLNIVATSLITISLINIGAYKFKSNVTSQDIKSTQNIEINSIDSRKPDTLRDIYYIILDRYASTSTLKEIYNFDNSEFIDYLSDKGFYRASKSTANYLVTDHSLASSLNMEYINYLSDRMGEESRNFYPLFEMMQDYKVWRFLKSKGYKFIHFGTWWRGTKRNKYADTNFKLAYSLSEFSQFLDVLYKTTMFHPIDWKLDITGFASTWRRQNWKRVLQKFDELAEVPNIKEPTFVFAHMLIPHDPYVFNRNGNFVTEEEERKRTKIVNYVDQLIFTNKKLKILIDKLLSDSELSPIIVLQADEGPYPQRYIADKLNFNWEQARKEELREKMRILNAYYLPGVDKDILYPSITPVNSFRLIFNLYFDTNFEFLPDENYAFVDEGHIYKFFNVTDKVKYQ